jgi:hypothetical protein
MPSSEIRSVIFDSPSGRSRRSPQRGTTEAGSLGHPEPSLSTRCMTRIHGRLAGSCSACRRCRRPSRRRRSAAPGRRGEALDDQRQRVALAAGRHDQDRARAVGSDRRPPARCRSPGAPPRGHVGWGDGPSRRAGSAVGVVPLGPSVAAPPRRSAARGRRGGALRARRRTTRRAAPAPAPPRPPAPMLSVSPTTSTGSRGPRPAGQQQHPATHDSANRPHSTNAPGSRRADQPLCEQRGTSGGGCSAGEADRDHGRACAGAAGRPA